MIGPRFLLPSYSADNGAVKGFRGRPPADVAALADTLVRVSWLAVHLNGHLTELDINPLMVLPAGRGVKAVDALAVLPSA